MRVEGSSLTILKDWEGGKNSKKALLCVCHCGTFKIIDKRCVVKGISKSCGCRVGKSASARCKTHGKTNTRAYSSWRGMKERCDNEKNSHFVYYGLRGICYNERWKKFENFLEDMGECPDNFQLERIDVDKDYSPENCKWVDKTQQAYNIRRKSNNSSCRTGVYQRDSGKWYASITYYGRVLTFNFCDSFEDACIIREFAELVLYGFTKK